MPKYRLNWRGISREVRELLGACVLHGTEHIQIHSLQSSQLFTPYIKQTHAVQLLRKLLLDGEDEASFQEVEYSSPTHHATPRNLGPKVAQKLGCPADGIPLHGKLLISQPGGSPTFSISSPMTATASLHIGPSPPDPV